MAGERLSLHGSTIGRSADAASVSNGVSGSIMSEISGTNTATGNPLASPTLPNRDSLHISRQSRRGSGWADGDDVERRSLSVRSASLKDASEGDLVEVMSVRDGSSNVGVWHGVPGKPRALRENPPE